MRHEIDRIKKIQLQESVAQFHLQTAPPDLIKEEPRIPGFKIADSDFPPTNGMFFGVGEQSGSDLYHLEEPLLKLGYVTVKETGSDQSHPRMVSFTDKAGGRNTYSFGLVYATGFNCYPAPDFHQCELPFLLDSDVDWTQYRITGIVQDQTQAKVNILIPWKMSKFALELRPYAAELEKSPAYDKDQYFYAWAHYLNSHPQSGESPAAIRFQKFDDGWRIVDENGNSLKEYETKK